MGTPDDASPPGGAYVTVELHPGVKMLPVERSREGTRQTAEMMDEATGTGHVVLHVSDADAREKLNKAVNDYWRGDLKKGKVPLASRMEPIEQFRPTVLMDFWREDPAKLPELGAPATWWALWCWEDFAGDIEDFASKLGMQVAPRDRWSRFPDVIILPVHATREQVQWMFDMGTPGLAELGHATDDPSILVNLPGEYQDGLVDDLASRIIWPGAEVPAVCILDTGVNRGHPLIEPALAPNETQTIDATWGADDHHRPGHGTAMAGVALHGDLTGPLADASIIHLRHRLESVKVLPPDNLVSDPLGKVNYGAIIQQAVALAEQRNPNRRRAICSAVTNDGRSGDRPSAWSAAIDAIAAGVDAAEGEAPPRRLFIQAMGNIAHSQDWSSISTADDHPGEDPAQAWNALTVGGVTFKDAIHPMDRSSWKACTGVGDLSPYSRTSCIWPNGTLPIKPEVVFEAGNRATNTTGSQVSDGMPSLSLVATGKGGAGDALMPFYATSAATAQASRMSAMIMAEHPDYWPETVRALIVHSARWTPSMQAEIDANTMTGRKGLRRKFGYGLPDLPRALASASHDLALVAQAEIQPFDRPERTRHNQPTGSVGFGRAHYYDLPWPVEILQELENTPVKLKVTLSYFVEPSPLAASMLDPARYRSFGLRFDLRRGQETESAFIRRRNAAAGKRIKGGGTDGGWMFGEKAVAAGSLHVDIWTGTAVELASRNQLCIHPVMGWWRSRPGLGRYFDKARYSLVVSLETPDVSLDVQAVIASTAKAMIDNRVGVGAVINT